MAIHRQKMSATLCLSATLALTILLLGVTSLRVEGASSIAQGFSTDDAAIVSGALVGLKAGSENSVELGSSANIDRLLGIAGQDSLIELSGGEGKVQVVTTGAAVALVSDLNGDIKAGDHITASPIAGVGMKATTTTVVIGTAQADFSSADKQSRTISDKEGNQKTVNVGAISLQVGKVFYEPTQESGLFVPRGLQDFANNIAGRSVSPMRIIIVGLLVIFVFVTVIAMLYSSVKSSIVSLGRNPLSEHAVHKSLLQVGITVIGVMVFTVIVGYLILTT